MGVKPKCGIREASAQNFAMVLERLAQQVDPGARVWRGSDLPAAQQGVTVLGTPLGRAGFVHAQLNQKLADHDTLLSRIPLVADVQSAWALLFALCRSGPITCCEWSDLNWSTISLKATMRGCGDVWHASSRQVWEPMEQRKQQHPCLWPWVEWVCAMRFLGQLG